MNYLITATSDYTYRQLNRQVCGTVHSVYRKTVNLRLGEQLLALQSASSPLSPISLITELNGTKIEALSIVPGQRVNIADEQIEIASGNGSVIFSYKSAKVFDLVLIPPNHSFDLTKLRCSISDALSHTDGSGFQPLFCGSPSAEPPLSPMHVIAEKRIAASRAFFTDGSYQKAAETLAGLIGLGIGLTPSGDDFLCGVLAGILFCNRNEHPFAQYLKQHLILHLQDTNDISAAFLSCALRGQFSQVIINLKECGPAEEVYADFSQIGHSSGMDTLCGLLYILDLPFL